MVLTGTQIAYGERKVTIWHSDWLVHFRQPASMRDLLHG